MLSICLCTLPLSQTPTILMLSVYCADTILMLSVCLCIHHHGTQSLPVQTPSWHSVFAYGDTSLMFSVCLCRHHPDTQCACADTILTLSVCLCRHHPDAQCLPVQTPPWRSVLLRRHHPDTQCWPMQTAPWRSVFTCADTTLTLSVCLCRQPLSETPTFQQLPGLPPACIFVLGEQRWRNFARSLQRLDKLHPAVRNIRQLQPQRPAQQNSWWKLNPPSFKIFFFFSERFGHISCEWTPDHE